MTANLVSDAMAGLGCVTFSFALMAFAAVLLAVHSGLLPDLMAKLRQAWTEAPQDEHAGGQHRAI